MLKTAFQWALIGIGCLILAYIGWRHAFHTDAKITESAPNTERFESHHVGLAFDFPNHYAQELKHVNEDTPDEYHVFVLTDASSTAPENGEAPPAITIAGIDVASSTDLEEWVKADKRSNYYLASDKTLAPTAVGGEPALAYRYSGLYENDAIAVKHQDRLYVFSVSWMAAGDQIRRDFDGIIKTTSYVDE
jgi:hypothetical protein